MASSKHISQMSNGPELWKTIWTPIADIVGPENVVIAGGCVRDYLLHQDMKPKDIDVFLRVDQGVDFELAIANIRSLSILDGHDDEDDIDALQIVPDSVPTGSRPPSSINGQASEAGWIGQATGFTEWRGDAQSGEFQVMVNIIGRSDFNSPSQLLEGFDINLCKAYAHPANDFQPLVHDLANIDLDNRTITFGLPEERCVEASLRRANRIQDRIFGFTGQRFELVGYDKAIKKFKDGVRPMKKYTFSAFDEVQTGQQQTQQWIEALMPRPIIPNFTDPRE